MELYGEVQHAVGSRTCVLGSNQDWSLLKCLEHCFSCCTFSAEVGTLSGTLACTSYDPACYIWLAATPEAPGTALNWYQWS